jgi:hypothetical protein
MERVITIKIEGKGKKTHYHRDIFGKLTFLELLGLLEWAKFELCEIQKNSTQIKEIKQ